MFRSEAVQHKDKKPIGVVVISTNPRIKLATTLIVLLLIIFTLILVNSIYNRKSTAVGRLVSNSGLIDVKAKDYSGTIETVWVGDGQLVKKGQKLITIATDRSSAQSEYLTLSLIAEVDNQTDLLYNSLSNAKKSFDNHIIKAQLNMQNTKREISLLTENKLLVERQRDNSKKLLDGQKALRQTKALSKNAYQEQHKKYLDLVIKVHLIERQLANLSNEYDNFALEIKQFTNDLESIQIEVNYKLSQLRQQKIDLSSRQNYTLYSALAGRVTGLRITVGRNVEANERLFVIAPKNIMLSAELFVPTKAIGFLEVGQPVLIRYEAFPYQKFGFQKGVISKIVPVVLSPQELPDTIRLTMPVYRVFATLDSLSITAYGKNIALQPGLLLDAEIVIAQLSFMEYLLDPLYQITGG